MAPESTMSDNSRPDVPTNTTTALAVYIPRMTTTGSVMGTTTTGSAIRRTVLGRPPVQPPQPPGSIRDDDDDCVIIGEKRIK